MLLNRRPLLPSTRLHLQISGLVTPCRQVKRQRLQPLNVGWDPEGILASPRGGHIARQQVQRNVKEDMELQKQYDAAKAEAAEELRKTREARQMPASHAETVEFLLSTNAEEMQFETTRCRPLLTPDFFEYVGEQIGQERFAARPDEARVAELQGLRDYLVQAVKDLDAKLQALSAPRERVMKLLQASDKRATLLQMAGDNEIDDGMLHLLQQNIDGARAAGQEQAAEFMTKLQEAARKYKL